MTHQTDPGPSTPPFVAPTARVEGNVTLAPGSSVFFSAVVRGVDAPVEVGANTNVQDNCLVEGTPGHPARLGANASLGHNARVLGATIEAGTLIAIGATVLPGAHVGSRCIVAANATVPEGMQVPDGSLVVGQGRIMRPVSDAEVDRIDYGVSEYRRLSSDYRDRLPG